MLNNNELKKLIEKQICKEHQKTATLTLGGNAINKKVTLNDLCCQEFGDRLTGMIADWQAEQDGNDIIETIKL